MAIKPKLLVRQVRSTIGCTEGMRSTIRGLGLRGRHDEVVVDNTPSFRGMVKKVLHLVEAQEIDKAPVPGRSARTVRARRAARTARGAARGADHG